MTSPSVLLCRSLVISTAGEEGPHMDVVSMSLAKKANAQGVRAEGPKVG
jgi:hypothetical protein